MQSVLAAALKSKFCLSHFLVLSVMCKQNLLTACFHFIFIVSLVIFCRNLLFLGRQITSEELMLIPFMSRFHGRVTLNNKTGSILKRNIEARSWNHCCSGKAINITYSDCVCSLRYLASNAHAPYCLL
jgi:hypothetical protein